MLQSLNDKLRYYSLSGDVEQVKICLSQGADVHVFDDFSLQVASEQGHLEVVKLLLAAGANVNPKTIDPLVSAGENGHFPVVKILLSAGAHCDSYALARASLYGQFQVVKFLLLKFPDIDLQKDDNAPLRYAQCNLYGKSGLRLVKLILLHYRDQDVIKKYFPDLFPFYIRMHKALRRFQLHVLDVLWRPGSRMCNKNYLAIEINTKN